MSGYFDQSVCSIESRCMVKEFPGFIGIYYLLFFCISCPFLFVAKGRNVSYFDLLECIAIQIISANLLMHGYYDESFLP